MKRFLKAMRRNRKGFTLIELLIVVGILGILSGVVTLGVTQFIGKGKAEASKTELHQVQTAVAALMSDNALALLDPLADPEAKVGTVDKDNTLVGVYDLKTYLVTDLSASGTYDVYNNGKVAVPAP